MRSILMILFVGAASAVLQKNNVPVYRAAPAPVISNAAQGQHGQMHPMTQQHAEERESQAFAQPEPTKAPAVTPPVTQSYMVWYYPNSPQGQVTGYQNTGGMSDYFNWFKGGDLVAGAGVVGLLALGSVILYPKIFTKAKSRAIRELVSEIKLDDVTRVARQVMDSIQKFKRLEDSS